MSTQIFNKRDKSLSFVAGRADLVNIFNYIKSRLFGTDIKMDNESDKSISTALTELDSKIDTAANVPFQYRGAATSTDNPKLMKPGLYTLERSDFPYPMYPYSSLWGTMAIFGSVENVSYGSYLIVASGSIWIGNAYKWDDNPVAWVRIGTF